MTDTIRTIYIASSWKNQHAVEMLTDLLEEIPGIKVNCFVRKSNEEISGTLSFEEWMHTKNAQISFDYDTMSAAECDLTIFLEPSGNDASAELGIAWANHRRCVGLSAKGENLGLMRKLCSQWFTNYKHLIEFVKVNAPRLKNFPDAIGMRHDDEENNYDSSLRQGNSNGV